jgi:hypothetical protein
LDTNDQPIELLRLAVACLDDGNLALLDFDTLRVQLTALIAHLEHHEQLSAQHALLRTDHEQRIAGMIKAIAAVDRKRSSMEDALARIDSLTHLTASELIAEYRRVSAAFRDSFPTTFYRLPVGARSVCGATLSERRHPERATSP